MNAWTKVRSGLEVAPGRIQGSPNLLWVLLGFLLAYVLFYLYPVFLAGTTMQAPQGVPSITPIGTDLRQTLNFLKAWLGGEGTPFIQTATYPPLSYLFFWPLLFVDYSARYGVLTVLTLAAYGVATLVFPLRVGRRRTDLPTAILIFATGLMSYGLQFELERGQFDVIAILLAYAAIWLYHSQTGRKIWAFVLLSVSVQLKLYPFIFVLLLVGDWRDWKHNAFAIAEFALANAALLFVMGPGVFVDFVNAIRVASVRPDLVWTGNHAIHGFVGLALQHAVVRGYVGLTAYAGLMESGLIGIVGLCLILIVWKAFRTCSVGLNRGLLLVCAVAACLIPTVSNDYKLSILAGPLAVFLGGVGPIGARLRGRIPLIVAVFVISFAYASTLFPYTYKPQSLVFQNNFPALFTILLAATAVSLWPGALPEEPGEAA